MRLILIVLIVLLGVVAMFAIQNPGVVTVHFLNYYADTSILIVIVVSFGLGVLVGLLPGIPTAFRRKRRVRELEADLAALRKSQPPPPPSRLDRSASVPAGNEAPHLPSPFLPGGRSGGHAGAQRPG